MSSCDKVFIFKLHMRLVIGVGKDCKSTGILNRFCSAKFEIGLDTEGLCYRVTDHVSGYQPGCSFHQFAQFNSLLNNNAQKTVNIIACHHIGGTGGNPDHR